MKHIFDADGCRALNLILEKKSDSMAVTERKTLMYAIKTIHEPFKMPKETRPMEPMH